MAHLLDVGGISEKHGEAVDAHAPAGGGGQPVLQGGTETLIDQLRLVITRLLVLRSPASTDELSFHWTLYSLWDPRN